MNRRKGIQRTTGRETRDWKERRVRLVKERKNRICGVEDEGRRIEGRNKGRKEGKQEIGRKDGECKYRRKEE